MTIEHLNAAAQKQLAEILPELLQATLNEYISYIQMPTAADKSPSFAKKQTSGKAAAGHLMLILKLFKTAGIDTNPIIQKDDLSQILLIAKQEFKNHLENFDDLEDQENYEDL